MNEKAVRYVLFLILFPALAVIPALGDGGATVPAAIPPASIFSFHTLFPVHAALMTLGFICFFTAAVFPAFRKGKPGWLRHHQTLASAGTLLSLSAFVAAYLMVGSSGGLHGRVPHAYLGFLVILVIVVTFLLGLLRMRMKPYTVQAIAAHRWMGRILLLLMALTVISGLFTARLLG